MASYSFTLFSNSTFRLLSSSRVLARTGLIMRDIMAEESLVDRGALSIVSCLHAASPSPVPLLLTTVFASPLVFLSSTACNCLEMLMASGKSPSTGISRFCSSCGSLLSTHLRNLSVSSSGSSMARYELTSSEKSVSSYAPSSHGVSGINFSASRIRSFLMPSPSWALIECTLLSKASLIFSIRFSICCPMASGVFSCFIVSISFAIRSTALFISAC